MEEPLPPASYNWAHLEFSIPNRLVRSIILWFVAFAMVYLAFTVIIYCKDKKDLYLNQENLNASCSKTP
jgi:uncharacterized RDD family membrane protein YckC